MLKLNLVKKGLLYLWVTIDINYVMNIKWHKTEKEKKKKNQPN